MRLYHQHGDGRNQDLEVAQCGPRDAARMRCRWRQPLCAQFVRPVVAVHAARPLPVLRRALLPSIGGPLGTDGNRLPCAGHAYRPGDPVAAGDHRGTRTVAGLPNLDLVVPGACRPQRNRPHDVSQNRSRQVPGDDRRQLSRWTHRLRNLGSAESITRQRNVAHQPRLHTMR